MIAPFDLRDNGRYLGQISETIDGGWVALLPADAKGVRAWSEFSLFEHALAWLRKQVAR